MIEQYLKVMESFKEHGISKVLAGISDRCVAHLKSDLFNPIIQPYFMTIHENGVPFTDFADNPDSISQIKKVMNALYHARLAFLDLEQLDVRRWNRTLFDMKLLYSKTIHEAYQACYLLTHMDVDLLGIFKAELKTLRPLFEKLKKLSEYVSTETDQLADKLKTYPLSYNIGWVTGAGFAQLKPNSNDINYNVVTEFGALLPGYIDNFIQYINQYSADLIQQESTLNQAKILELQNAAYKLLNGLDNLNKNRFFIPIGYLNYIRIINHTLTLSMNTLEQLGNLSQSTQDLIRSNLARLKYDILPTLFGLADKMEDNALLTPGTLSMPLMNFIKPLYKWLITLASKPVDFYAKGEELLSIEDSLFLERRLELTYKRINEAQQSLFKIDAAQEAFDQFFNLMENPLYQNYCVHQLPQELKQALTTHYKLIQPYVKTLDIDLNNALIDSLKQPETWFSYLNQPVRWVTRQVPIDHAIHLKAQREALQALINKDRASKTFHIKLNKNLIDSVNKNAQLVLFPYSGRDVFVLDEAEALSPNQNDLSTLAFVKQKDTGQHLSVAAFNQLTSEQALILSQWYKNKHDKLDVAHTAYLSFIKHLNALTLIDGTVQPFDKLDKATRDECRNLYNLFQPYFMSAISEEGKDKAINIDQYLAHLFSSKRNDMDIELVCLFTNQDENFQEFFTANDTFWLKKSRQYLRLATKKYQEENELAPIESSHGDRAHYLIQHTDFSNRINKLRIDLHQLTALFNTAMSSELKAQTTGVPYPELANKNQTLAQCKQSMALKSILNGLYHLEEIVLKLEKISNKHTEARYVYHLLEAYAHINEIMTLTKILSKEAHFQIIAREMITQIQTLIATLQTGSMAYQADPETIYNSASVENNALWYTLNAFFITPAHIQQLRQHQQTTPEAMSALQTAAKQATIKIETIIKSSNSYFKLFLQTPNMYALYKSLTTQLNALTSSSHDAIMNNLNKIRSTTLTPMLIEADHWEDAAGLVPGSLSGPLKAVCDEFFKGFFNPLGLKSNEYLALICDKQPLQKRLVITQNNQAKALARLERIHKKFQPIEALFQLMNEYACLEDIKNPVNLHEHDALKAATEQQLLQAFNKAFQKLVRLQKKFPSEATTDIETKNFDNKLNSTAPQLTQIKALVTTAHHHYLGLCATHQMSADIANEKLIYLNQLNTLQDAEDQRLIQEYTATSFQQHMETYCNRHLGLHYVYNEYKTKLAENLLAFKNNISAACADKQDIDQNVNCLLKEKIHLFEQTHFAKYYQLETVKDALSQCVSYFNANHTVYENIDTLDKKIKLINSLDDLAENKELSVEKRIAAIKAIVDTESFKGTLTAHVGVDTLSFAFLKRCLYYLLEALHLYVPPGKTLVNQIRAAVTNKPPIHELTNRFGLFQTTRNVFEMPLPALNPTL